MRRVSDPTVKMEIEALENRLEKLEQSLRGNRESASSKNESRQLNTYRVVKEDGNHFIEFKHKDGWVRSDASSFKLR